MTANPVLASVTRGTVVESRHRGAFVVTDSNGKVMRSAGDIETPVYPRSAIKAFQCLPVIESGAAEAFKLTDEEIAICCSSHIGAPLHVKLANSILHKCGCAEKDLECGAQWPDHRPSATELTLAKKTPGAVFNTCSGKHAGMLALAKHMGAETWGYTGIHHPVQLAVAKTIEQLCDIDLTRSPVGADGCSVPTWAMPLRNIAQGFARLGQDPSAPAQRIIRASKRHPQVIEGDGMFNTDIMRKLPRLFIKYGAEGVYCGSIPHVGLGFAVKIDDGSRRGVDVAVAAVLASLDVWSEDEVAALKGLTRTHIRNRRNIAVGEVRAESL